MEVAAHAELRHLEFVGPKDLAGAADGVVLGMIEVVDIVDVSADLRSKELGIERNFFDAAVPFSQVKSAKENGAGFSELCGVAKADSAGTEAGAACSPTSCARPAAFEVIGAPSATRSLSCFSN